VSTRRALRRSIEGFSETLGPTAAAVAGTLRQLDVRGTPKDSTQCALARCLWAIVGSESSVTKVAVTDRSIHVKRSPYHLPVIVRLPKPVRTFIRAFDSGCYPELVGPELVGPELVGPELVGTDYGQPVVGLSRPPATSATMGEGSEAPVGEEVK
jgi:hypothetical protein